MKNLLAAVAVLVCVTVACGGSPPAQSQSGGQASGGALLVNGAGATFPYPLYSKWFSDYSKLHPDVHFNYQSIGSGGGIQQFTAGTVDFGASDAPLTDEQIAKAPGVVHVPTVMGAVVVTYNAPISTLKLTPQLLAQIYLGKITKWNDPQLAKVNAGVKLPDAAISVAHRSDGSGTTYVFTNYLSKVSPEWKAQVGNSTSVKWPVGLGGKGNEGVTGLVKQNPGAIGYVELAYANQNKLPLAELQNKDGVFLKPTLESTSAAAAGVEMPEDYRVSITDASGKDAWPIASFTYLLVHKDAQDQAKGEAIVRFLWWATHDGQKLAPPLDYAPLPQPVVERVSKTIQSLQVAGKPVALAQQ
ncbi:MAG TPA: phosphate ABC transporter substrate-binding protein PstS [Vicinamibacteria bacterium]|nr:phosphate ABC transporter substrate-binding protein PstS [Vicinamibacteria bacterium]